MRLIIVSVFRFAAKQSARVLLRETKLIMEFVKPKIDDSDAFTFLIEANLSGDAWPLNLVKRERVCIRRQEAHKKSSTLLFY